jgi:hypothetical protein
MADKTKKSTSKKKVDEGKTTSTYTSLYGTPQLNLTKEESRRALNPTAEEVKEDYLRHLYTKGSGKVEESDSPIDLLGPVEIKAAMSAVKAGAKALPKVAKYATTKTPLKDAYKINPWAFKPDPEAAYRMIGDEVGLASAKESGLIKPSLKGSDIGKIHTESYYTMGAPSDTRDYFNRSWGRGYEGPYMVEVPNAAKDVRFSSGPFGKEMGAHVWTYPENYIPISEANFYKQHWLKGYKKIDVPTQLNTGGYLDTNKGKEFSEDRTKRGYYYYLGESDKSKLLDSLALAQSRLTPYDTGGELKKYDKGGKKENAPIEYTDYSKYLKAKRAYDDSMALHKTYVTAKPFFWQWDAEGEKVRNEENAKAEAITNRTNIRPTHMLFEDGVKVPYKQFLRNPPPEEPVMAVFAKPKQRVTYKKQEAAPKTETKKTEVETSFTTPFVLKEAVKEEPFKPNKFTYKDNVNTYYWHQKTPTTVIPITKEEYTKLYNVPEKKEKGGWLEEYAKGGNTKTNTLEGDLISKVIMNRNKNKDFVQRAYAVGMYPESNMFSGFDPETFGNRMSHKMVWGEDESGQAYMYPSVYNPGNEDIKVPNQYADYISSEGYKKASGMEYAKGGKLIKRADGSYSRRGLWDNIRANKGSGKKPTKEMLEQEAKIKAEYAEGGNIEKYDKGGKNKTKVYTDYEEYLKAQKAYDDSLAAYNMGNRMIKEYNDAIRRGREAGTPLRIIPTNHLTPYPGTNILPIESRTASPTGTAYGPEDADSSLWATYSRFKKPVQPVGYEKSKQEILPVKNSNTSSTNKNKKTTNSKKAKEKPVYEKPEEKQEIVVETPTESTPFKPSKSTYTDNANTYYWYQKTPSTTIPVTKEEYNRLKNVPETKAKGGWLNNYK